MVQKKKSSAGFAAQARKFGKKIRLSKEDVDDYIADSRDQMGKEVPKGALLKRDMRMYKKAME